MAIAVSVAFAVLLVVLLVRLNPFSRGDNEPVSKNRIGDGLRRLKALQKQYAVLTEETLFATPDAELIEAVLANLWSKMEAGLSDAHEVMRGVSDGRQDVYALYAVTGGVRQDGLAGVLKGEDAALVSRCVRALETIGAAQSAEILRKAMAAEKPGALDDAYLESFDAEDGKARMIAYIRQNPAAFCDRP